MDQRVPKSVLAAVAVAAVLITIGCAQLRQGGAGVPAYAVDAAWPKPLPNNWNIGQVAGIAVDARDHVWLIHHPKTLIDEEKGAALSPPRAKCCVAAPPVIEFDGEGNLLRAWGGPGQGYEWFENEHGCTTSASTPRATCIRPRSAAASACRNSGRRTSVRLET